MKTAAEKIMEKMQEQLAQIQTKTTKDQPDALQQLIASRPVDPMESVRVERNRLLGLCDWTQAVDAPLNESQKQTWQTYRQELRDLTQKYTLPNQVVWPRRPDA